MVNSAAPAIITAISDSNFEGFVSSNLHSQGWDIVARAVDFEALDLSSHQNGLWRNRKLSQNFIQYVEWKYRWMRQLRAKLSSN